MSAATPSAESSPPAENSYSRLPSLARYSTNERFPMPILLQIAFPFQGPWATEMGATMLRLAASIV